MFPKQSDVFSSMPLFNYLIVAVCSYISFAVCRGSEILEPFYVTA